MGALVDHVYDQLWAEYGKPTHPEDVANLRDTIAEIAGHVLAYTDTHQPCQRWHDGDEPAPPTDLP